MRKELELKIANRWPGWFDLTGDPRRTSMCFGFAHGDGWFDLVWRLCEQIEPIVLAGAAETREWGASLDSAKNPAFEVYQVKEKLGGLEFHTNSRSGAIHELIGKAGAQSILICDVCGKPGLLRSDAGGRGWLRTKCEEHVDTRQRY
jgi:hypothetical protein